MAKILILEDDKDLQEGLSFALGMEGYETVCFSSAAEAGKFMKQTSVDFLLLDCGLPDGNGFDFCRELRKYSQIPILMLTARD